MPKSYVAAFDFVVGTVDILNFDELHIWADRVLCTKVQNLPRVGNASNERARHTLAVSGQFHVVHRCHGLQGAAHHNRAVTF